MEKALTIQEYAAKVGKHQATIYRQISNDKLEYYKDGNKIMITGEKVEGECEWVQVFPGEPASHLSSGCGHPIYLVTGSVKTFKYCPWCAKKINREKYNDKN